MVAQGTFRQDLWFRLSVFPIRVPPLRERKMDLPALVHHLLDKKARELRLPSLSELPFNAIDPLLAYDWPGNVRELENVIERALILCGAGPLVLAPMLGAAHPISAVPRGDAPKLDAVVREHIEDALAKTQGRIHGPNGAAELLGINPGTLRHRMDKLGIAYGRRRGPQRRIP
jgi:transcriptional regulator with GAF, ATPase, and Fis domain